MISFQSRLAPGSGLCRYLTVQCKILNGQDILCWSTSVASLPSLLLLAWYLSTRSLQRCPPRHGSIYRLGCCCFFLFLLPGYIIDWRVRLGLGGFLRIIPSNSCWHLPSTLGNFLGCPGFRPCGSRPSMEMLWGVNLVLW